MSYKIQLHNSRNLNNAGDYVKGHILCTFEVPTRLRHIKVLYQVREVANLGSEEPLSTNTILTKQWPIIYNGHMHLLRAVILINLKRVKFYGVLEKRQHGVGAYGEHTYNISCRFPDNFEIPNLGTSRLFEVDYVLLIEGCLEGCRMNLFVKILPSLLHLRSNQTQTRSDSSLASSLEPLVINPLLEHSLATEPLHFIDDESPDSSSAPLAEPSATALLTIIQDEPPTYEFLFESNYLTTENNRDIIQTSDIAIYSAVKVTCTHFAFMSCRILLENYNGFYAPGTEIIGRVQCNFDSLTILRYIRIELERVEVNRWYGFSYKTRGSRYIGCHDVIIIDTIIYGTENGIHHFSTGTHDFPFVLNLPTNLPSTYRSPYSAIAYQLKAVVYPLISADFHSCRMIKIVAPLFYHSFPPEDLTAKIFENDKTVGCRCYSSGQISMVVTMPRMVFAPSETIDVGIHLTNLSNKNVGQLKVSFDQVITLKAIAPSDREKLLKDELFRTVKHGVGAHGEHTYNISIPIPSNTEIPNFTDCKLMKVHYLLLIKACFEGYVSDFKMNIYPNLVNVGLEVVEDALESLSQTTDLTEPTEPSVPLLEIDLPSYQSSVAQPLPLETPPPTYNNILRTS